MAKEEPLKPRTVTDADGPRLAKGLQEDINNPVMEVPALMLLQCAARIPGGLPALIVGVSHLIRSTVGSAPHQLIRDVVAARYRQAIDDALAEPVDPVVLPPKG